MINTERICNEFATMAAIDSPSFYEAPMAEYLQKRFAELGAAVEFDASGANIGSNSNNMIARFAGTRSGEPLILSGHMDTVTPAENVQPVLRDGVFTSAGDTILGSDDKAGLTEIIEAISVLQENSIPYPPLEVVVTICEEQGLLGAKHFAYSSLKGRRGVALDTSGIDVITHRAPCANRFKIDICGKEAHAGICPEQGLSAILVAGRALSRMTLGRIDHETTANIGQISGGQATNIIPSKVTLHGEVRSHDLEKLRANTEAIIRICEEEVQQASTRGGANNITASMAIELYDDYPAMHVPQDAGIITLLQEAGAELGRPQTIQSAGGGSDANIFNANGIEMVIIGSGMDKVHTIHEQVKVADMEAVSALLVELIRRA